MWTYHPDLLAKPVPRYTSYPTAADFGPLEEGAIERAIAGASGDVSLYLHIPFCEQICYYCGCNTGASGKRARVETYLAALHQEIATVASLLPQGARVRRIAFGGGSPNAILPRELLALVDSLHAHFPLVAPEWSIELDPRSLTEEWRGVVREVGITASEGYFAVPLGQDWGGGALWTIGHVLEFIGEDGQPRWAWELEVGERVQDVASFLRILAEAPPTLQPIAYCNLRGCPSKRACPACGVIIEYESACKHFNCAMCHHRFCFICLKSESQHAQGKWSISYSCEIAPVQTQLPSLPTIE
jgi:hypothetical protein